MVGDLSSYIIDNTNYKIVLLNLIIRNILDILEDIPGWQSNALQIPFSVENLIAQIFPVLILDRLTLEIPTFSANSFRDIFLSAITLSNLNIIILSQSVIGFILQKISVTEDYRKTVHHDAYQYASQ